MKMNFPPKLKVAISSITFAIIPVLLLTVTSGVGQSTDSQDRRLEHVNTLNVWPNKDKRWALIIGVDEYADTQISRLTGAANDARLLARALIANAGFPEDQVIVLASDQPPERKPTRLNILRRLSNLRSLVPKDGLLLMSFAGHGIERNGQAYLVPSDAQLTDDVSFLEESAISLVRVRDGLKSTGVGQIIILLDACRNDPGGRADAPNLLSPAYVKAFNFDIRNREVQAFAVLYATEVGKRAYEYTEMRQGYFTWAVVRALEGAASNDRGEITLANLITYVQGAVPKRIALDLGKGKEQRPFAIIEGYRANELVIAVATPATGNTTLTDSSLFNPASIELSFWESIRNSTDPQDFESYLQKYPNGQFSVLAKRRIEANREKPKSIPTADNFFTIRVTVRNDKATNGWVNSGLVVRRGQRLRISASGRIQLGGGQNSSPDGLPHLSDQLKLMRSQSTGGLIGVIGGDNDEFFFIGSWSEIVAPRSGVLFLGVNEGMLEDNLGQYEVLIEAEVIGNTPR